MEKQAGLEVILNYFDDFSAQQIDQLKQLPELYQHWNEQINVISRKDIDELYVRHVLHSLSIAAVCPFNPGMRIVDIGTGGGFPGIPLAIFYPGVDFLLVDSIGKKLKVVQGVAESIGLRNVKVLHSRMEELPQQEFDFAVSRAVAPLKDLWRWCRPYIKKRKSTELANGLICLKGGDLAQEISESGLRPSLWPVDQIFPEPHFADKYVVWAGK
ncbi:16S rRNA (guanine(527)-N(7))-methyltransferase RsmG [Taibaiella helva]|uniref:16S rRNA (guanine(527)-N(7))-methyltransferase RsmG n=1 Tax=Taibaiella helva TaxID=2301235 RepID=UPI001E5364FA|nr:16S rRNA (guanine(527)-N(7))-methyltransferase RsmG [Taibaiella helva]